MRTENVRADRLNLGDSVLFPCVVGGNGLVTEMFVTSLDLPTWGKVPLTT